jgi:hypothetical protein
VAVLEELLIAIAFTSSYCSKEVAQRKLFKRRCLKGVSHESKEKISVEEGIKKMTGMF